VEKRWRWRILMGLLCVGFLGIGIVCEATDAALYFSRDAQGRARALVVQEGEAVWVVVYDPDENIDLARPDVLFADIVLFDPHTGALLAGVRSDAPGLAMTETGPDVGLFVSDRPIRIGGRASYNEPVLGHHVAGPDFVHADGNGEPYFENMDSVLAMYRDKDEDGDAAVSILKIVDTQAAIAWSERVYADEASAAQLLVCDPDENLDPGGVEYVPVFVLVNPGSWTPSTEGGPSTFIGLLGSGGVDGRSGAVAAPAQPISPYTIYNATANAHEVRGAADGRYYINYPASVDDWVAPAAHRICPVSFLARETGPNTGEFQLDLDDLAADLNLPWLAFGDTLVAYYLDPNDFDDFTLDVACVAEDIRSETAFVRGDRAVADGYGIGADAVYVQVLDANANVDPCCPETVLVHAFSPAWVQGEEWLELHEVISNSPAFFSFAGAPLAGALPGSFARAQTIDTRDDGRIELPNEATLCVRYNDAFYEYTELPGLGDGDLETAWPPAIRWPRVRTDVSFALVRAFDTQVVPADSEGTVAMYFLDREGQRVAGYQTSDAVFLEVVDPDQNEDPQRRERIDAFSGAAAVLAPQALNPFACELVRSVRHPVHEALGDTNIFGDGNAPRIYVLNPRNGRWAGLDLYETGASSGRFVSLDCVAISSPYSCVPTLEGRPGDTLIACYQDPSNPSDAAWIAIQISIGGDLPPAAPTPGQ